MQHEWELIVIKVPPWEGGTDSSESYKYPIFLCRKCQQVRPVRIGMYFLPDARHFTGWEETLKAIKDEECHF